MKGKIAIVSGGRHSALTAIQLNEAYQQGRADAIEESKVIFRKYMMTKDIDGLDRLLEQLKERDT